MNVGSISLILVMEVKVVTAHPTSGHSGRLVE